METKETICTHLNNKNPIPLTAARLTSSFTSETFFMIVFTYFKHFIFVFGVKEREKKKENVSKISRNFVSLKICE